MARAPDRFLFYAGVVAHATKHEDAFLDGPTISSPRARLTSSVKSEALEAQWIMVERDRLVSDAIDRTRVRLRDLIRRQVADPRDAEDLLQDVR